MVTKGVEIVSCKKRLKAKEYLTCKKKKTWKETSQMTEDFYVKER